MGPADAIVAGGTVTVTKRSGEQKTEKIGSVGKNFTRDGARLRYGYPERRESRVACPKHNGAARASQARNGYQPNYAPRSCQDCQDVEDMSDAQGCARHRGNPRN